MKNPISKTIQAISIILILSGCGQNAEISNSKSDFILKNYAPSCSEIKSNRYCKDKPNFSNNKRCIQALQLDNPFSEELIKCSLHHLDRQAQIAANDNFSQEQIDDYLSLEQYWNSRYGFSINKSTDKRIRAYYDLPSRVLINQFTARNHIGSTVIGLERKITNYTNLFTKIFRSKEINFKSAAYYLTKLSEIFSRFYEDQYEAERLRCAFESCATIESRYLEIYNFLDFLNDIELGQSNNTSDLVPSQLYRIREAVQSSKVASYLTRMTSKLKTNRNPATLNEFNYLKILDEIDRKRQSIYNIFADKSIPSAEYGFSPKAVNSLYQSVTNMRIDLEKGIAAHQVSAEKILSELRNSVSFDKATVANQYVKKSKYAQVSQVSQEIESLRATATRKMERLSKIKERALKNDNEFFKDSDELKAAKVLSFSAADAKYAPNSGQNPSSLYINHPEISFKQKTKVTINVGGKWGPRCAIEKAKNSSLKDVDTRVATVGPMGYFMDYANSKSKLSSVVSGRNSERTDSSGASVSIGGAIADLIGIGVSGSTSKSSGKFNSRNTTKNDSTAQSLQVSGGLRLENTPVPELAAGSLVAVVVDKNNQNKYYDIIAGGHVMSLTLDPGEALRFIVNDCKDTKLNSSSERLTVNIAAYTSAKEDALKYFEKLEKTAKQLAKNLSEINVVNDIDIENEFNAAMSQLAAYKANQNLRSFSEARLNQITAKYRALIPIRNFKNQISLLLTDIEALEKNAEFDKQTKTLNEAALSQLSITSDLVKLKDTVAIIYQNLYKMFAGTSYVLFSQEDREQFADALRLSEFDGLYTVAQKQLKLINNIEKTLYDIKEFSSPRSKSIILSYPRPGTEEYELLSSSDQMISSKIWSDFLDDDDYMLMDITMEDLFGSELASSKLRCGDQSLITTKIAFAVTTSDNFQREEYYDEFNEQNTDLMEAVSSTRAFTIDDSGMFEVNISAQLVNRTYASLDGLLYLTDKQRKFRSDFRKKEKNISLGLPSINSFEIEGLLDFQDELYSGDIDLESLENILFGMEITYKKGSCNF